ncbi:hypothetical protein BTH42_32340 [Burkholderia sp. SRS-W-2-2016]|uniref:transporter substrate-binding domain-containing protein n=1 Tax=Burkholderia sp. SRS-W-2-2016 TaxID=1926878 RepID=UPI00094B4927|nr:transporter substrate-binding domain-containing protein [Burkholderia sp. SRS-W-2-2016]OLL27527.1 hypothetical protein BTH42_32340 [Burkholderia sp. SRS-W-2-2016]
MKAKLIHILLGSASALMLLTAATASHADQVDTIKASGVLKCGMAAGYTPYSFVEDPKTRQLVGYDVDMCNAIAQQLGVKAEPVFVTGATRITDLQQGRTDIALAALTNTPERARLIDFSQNYMVTGVRIVVPASANVKSFADLTGKRIAGTDGSNLEIKLAKVIQRPQVKVFPSPSTGFLAFEQGKVEAMAGDDTTLLGLMGPTGNKYTLLDQYVTKEQLGVGVRKGETRLLAAVNQTLTELEKSGKAAGMFDKWFGQESKLKMKRSFVIGPYQAS